MDKKKYISLEHSIRKVVSGQLTEDYHVKDHPVHGKVLAKNNQAQAFSYDMADKLAEKHNGSLSKLPSGKYLVKIPETSSTNMKVEEGFINGPKGDKPEGTPRPFTKQVHIEPHDGEGETNKAAEHLSGARVTAKSSNAEPIKMESEGGVVPNQGDAATVASWPGAANTEDGKKKIKQEAEGTAERKKVEYVGRPNTSSSPKDVKSKLGRQAAYKTNVIDESNKAEMVKQIVAAKKQELINQELKKQKQIQPPTVTGEPATKIEKSPRLSKEIDESISEDMTDVWNTTKNKINNFSTLDKLGYGNTAGTVDKLGYGAAAGLAGKVAYGALKNPLKFVRGAFGGAMGVISNPLNIGILDSSDVNKGEDELTKNNISSMKDLGFQNAAHQQEYEKKYGRVTYDKDQNAVLPKGAPDPKTLNTGNPDSIPTSGSSQKPVAAASTPSTSSSITTPPNTGKVPSSDNISLGTNKLEPISIGKSNPTAPTSSAPKLPTDNIPLPPKRPTDLGASSPSKPVAPTTSAASTPPKNPYDTVNSGDASDKSFFAADTAAQKAGLVKGPNAPEMEDGGKKRKKMTESLLLRAFLDFNKK